MAATCVLTGSGICWIELQYSVQYGVFYTGSNRGPENQVEAVV